VQSGQYDELHEKLDPHDAQLYGEPVQLPTPASARPHPGQPHPLHDAQLA
jgi:hypothetical protein